MANQYLLPLYKRLFGKDFDYSVFEMRRNMQKAVYLLQNMGVSLGGYGFRWYRHGPYSQALQNDMHEAMRGPAAGDGALDRYSDQIKKLKLVIDDEDRGEYDVDLWMECLASLHYLRNNIMDYDADKKQTLDELVRTIPELKNRDINDAAYRLLTWAMRESMPKGGKAGNGKLVFEGQILDNVHGFISYTSAEKKIMSTQLFRRLQNIKQLSVVNWVFPGSEHTRFIHSLGVMHIADKMAMSLKLTNRERRILRLAGLLHDVGHYPLSHVGETPYDREVKPASASDPADFCRQVNEDVVARIRNMKISFKPDYMTGRTDMHHEAMGGRIVVNDPEIRKILVSELGSDAPGIIADIITGCVDRPRSVDPLLVQIMHSELDADGIDYIMRDSASAGTNFGACEIDQLIRCLTIGYYQGRRILCVKPKGIPAADQYLINKFFHYSQVIFNRHIVVSEWMAEQVINWMRINGVYFPTESELYRWSEKGVGEDYLAFNDNLFWKALDHLRRNELPESAVGRIPEVPEHIRFFANHLICHDEPEVAKRHEIRVVSGSGSGIREELEKAEICNSRRHHSEWVTILNSRTMSSQVPEKLFLRMLDRLMKDPKSGIKTEEDKLQRMVDRVMECITVCDYNGDVHLLCDDRRSLMRTMYRQTVVILRSYKYAEKK